MQELMFDLKKMNKDIPIRDALFEYAGISQPFGKKNISCPSRYHVDKKPSAKIYDNNNICICFSCNTTFTPLKLAMERYDTLPFREVCKRMISDFGLNIYEYSNLAEIEKMNKYKNSNKFFDYFVLTDKDLKTVGIINGGKPKEITYEIGATKLYKHYFGEEIPKHLKTHNEDGTEIKIKAMHFEAVEMGIIPRDAPKYYDYLDLKELWKEDKNFVEEMILKKSQEKIEFFEDAKEILEKRVSEYRKDHDVSDIKRIDEMRKEYDNSESERVFSKEETKEIFLLGEYEIDKDFIRFASNRIQKIENVADKLKEHRTARVKNKEKNNYCVGY